MNVSTCVNYSPATKLNRALLLTDLVQKTEILSWGCLGKAGTSEDSAKGAKEKQNFCQQACICSHRLLNLIGDIFLNAQVDKVEKHLAQNIFCRRLNSALGADVPDIQRAELHVSLWQWVGSAQESLLNEISLFSPLTPFCSHCSGISALQTGLLCLNADRRGAPGVHQTGSSCLWGCSVHRARLQLV